MGRIMLPRLFILSAVIVVTCQAGSASAVLLYENLTPLTTVGDGTDIFMESLVSNPIDLGAGSSFDAVGLRDSNTDIGGVSTSGTLWMSFTIQSLTGTQPANFAALQFYNNGFEQLGIGKAFNNFAFSTFGIGGDVDLNRADDGSIELLDTDVHLVVVRTDFEASGDDTATIWLDPDLSEDLSAQASNTRTGDLAFDQVRLRSGNAHAFTFDDVRFATTFAQAVAIPEPSAFLFGGAVCIFLGLRNSRRRSSMI